MDIGKLLVVVLLVLVTRFCSLSLSSTATASTTTTTVPYPPSPSPSNVSFASTTSTVTYPPSPSPSPSPSNVFEEASSRHGVQETPNAIEKPEKASSYQLALQWPTAYCTFDIKCKKFRKTAWTIHGLWPFDSNGQIFTCAIWKFGSRKLGYLRQDLKDRLSRGWPNLDLNFDDYYFWQSEYKNHAVCTDKYWSGAEYTSRTLELIRDINARVSSKYKDFIPANAGPVYFALTQNGVNPGKWVEPEVIRKSFGWLDGIVISVNCGSFVSKKKETKYYLKEIIFCYDENLKIIPCVGTGLGKCLPRGEPVEKEVLYFVDRGELDY